MDANTPWRIGDFHPDDLDAAVRLRDNPAASVTARLAVRGAVPVPAGRGVRGRPGSVRALDSAFLRHGHGKEEVTTADVLRGIAETRRTLTAELVADFEQDIKDYARV